MELHQVPPPIVHTLSLLGHGTLIDASTCGSEAYRTTRVWQNLLPRSTLESEHARLPQSARPVEAALEAARLSTWGTHWTPHLADEQGRSPLGSFPQGNRPRTWAPTRTHLLVGPQWIAGQRHVIRVKPPLPTFRGGQGSPRGLPHRKYRRSWTLHSPKSTYIRTMH